MRRERRILSAVFALAFLGAAAAASGADVIDLNASDTTPATISDGEIVYVTNSGGVAKTDSITGDFTVEAGGKLYVGLKGTDAFGGYAVASEKITLAISGDMNMNGSAWIGKWNMSGANAMYLAIFPEFEAAATGEIVVTVGGDLIVDASDALYAAADAFSSTSSTTITVTGDTILRSGGNHFVAYNNGSLTLTTRTFQLDGGEIEVIGSSSSGFTNKTQVITTATSGNVVHLTNHADLTIMRSSLFNLSAGGNFTVENGSTLIGGSGGGEIALASSGALTISADSAIDMWRGSLAVTGAGSTADIDGTLILGFNSTIPGFTSFTGVNVTVGQTGKIAVTDEFMTKALNDYSSSAANALVLSGTSSLTYSPDPAWTSGDKALIENYYGRFVFTRTGDNIYFKQAEAPHLATEAAARAAAADWIEKIYSENGVDPGMALKGYSDIALGAGVSVMGLTVPGVAPIAGDGSEAARLNRSIAAAILKGAGAEYNSGSSYIPGVTGVIDANFMSGFASMTTNNRGAHVNGIAMGAAGLARDSVLGRIADNNAVLARVRDSVGSDAALASSILNRDAMNRVWVGGLGMWEDADARKGMAGYRYDAYGIVAGYDRLFGPVTLGAAFGYAAGDYEDKAAVAHDSDIGNYALSLYAAYNHPSGFFASVVGGYTYSDNDIREFDGTNWAQEDFHTDTWNAGAALGYDWRPAPGLTLTPSIGVNHINARNSGHEVQYSGVGLLRYGGASNHATTLPAGLAANYEIPAAGDARINLNAKIGYSYSFGNDGLESDVLFNGLGVGALRASGREPGRHSFSAGAGVNYRRGCFDVGVRYDYSGKAGYDAHRVAGTVGISF